MTNVSLEELAEKGNKYYLEQLANKLEPKHNGKYVVIEIDSGKYYLKEDLLEAIEEAKEKHPGKLFHIVEVGGVSRVSRSEVIDNAWIF